MRLERNSEHLRRPQHLLPAHVRRLADRQHFPAQFDADEVVICRRRRRLFDRRLRRLQLWSQCRTRRLTSGSSASKTTLDFYEFNVEHDT